MRECRLILGHEEETVKSKGNLEMWRSLISDWRKGGLSRSEFCTKRSIAVSTFDYWNKKVKSSATTFVEVPISVPEAGIATIRLKYGESFTIELLRGFDRHELEVVLRTIGALP